MPHYSPDRGLNLFSAEELASILEISARAVRKAASRSEVYFEWHIVTVPGRAGGRRTKFFDVTTTGYQIDVALLGHSGTSALVPASNGAGTARRNFVDRGSVVNRNGDCAVKNVPHMAAVGIGQEERSDLLEINFAAARKRLQILQPVLALPKMRRAEAVRQLAEDQRLHPRTIYRWIQKLEEEGLRGLSQQRRGDTARLRIPADAYGLIVSALVTNPPTTPVPSIHRTLMRAVPDAMTYERAGSAVGVSVSTVRRVRQNLLSDPQYRLLFFDVDKRKEYLRSYVGEVVSAHANDLWQMDMTRCDVMVVDPEIGHIFRPRVHAIIDVYSGCIPAIVFSTEENQAQTDLAILRAVLPKSGPFAAKYPVFGVPQRLYLDNGKTYTSEQAHRVLGGLGVEVIHSLPRVKHTRGRIERFFGTLHSFERSLPGYVGKDASDRSSAELKRLTRNTRAWLEHGRDPGEVDRLLTIGEYQNYVLAWLVAEYHAWPVHGKTRLEHFTESAPARTQVVLDRAELMLLFAERSTRVVEPSGTIRLENQRWSIPDGSLIRFQGKKVLVLRDQFTLGDDRRLIVWKDRHGRLEVIGEAVPAPTVAESLEAGELRRASKAEAQRAVREARKQARELTDPELRVSAQLMKEAEVVLEPVVPAGPRGRLGAVNPVDPRDALDPDDLLVKYLRDPLGSLSDGPSDPVERLRWIRERREREDS